MQQQDGVFTSCWAPDSWPGAAKQKEVGGDALPPSSLSRLKLSSHRQIFSPELLIIQAHSLKINSLTAVINHKLSSPGKIEIRKKASWQVRALSLRNVSILNSNRRAKLFITVWTLTTLKVIARTWSWLKSFNLKKKKNYFISCKRDFLFLFLARASECVWSSRHLTFNTTLCVWSPVYDLRMDGLLPLATCHSLWPMHEWLNKRLWTKLWSWVSHSWSEFSAIAKLIWYQESWCLSSNLHYVQSKPSKTEQLKWFSMSNSFNGSWLIQCCMPAHPDSLLVVVHRSIKQQTLIHKSLVKPQNIQQGSHQKTVTQPDFNCSALDLPDAFWTRDDLSRILVHFRFCAKAS